MEWLLDLPPEEQRAYPSFELVRSGQTVAYLTAPVPALEATTSDFVTPTRQLKQHQKIFLKVAQYNTRSISLSSKKSSVAYIKSMRAHMTRYQFQERGTHFVGIQEARTPMGPRGKGTSMLSPRDTRTMPGVSNYGSTLNNHMASLMDVIFSSCLATSGFWSKLPDSSLPICRPLGLRCVCALPMPLTLDTSRPRSRASGLNWMK